MSDNAASSSPALTAAGMGNGWTESETWVLIRLWEDHLSELRGEKHNSRVYDAIVTGLAQRGIVRTRWQVQHKIDNFTQKYSSYTITPEILRVVRNSKKRYSERLALEKEQSAKRPREEPEAGPSSEGQDLQKEVETAKKMLTNAELLIAHGLKTKDFAEVESGNSL
ncbi:hypothetical protein HPB52_019969 [Rhipicephalus sanguineus]|uniref:Myb/SANT-like DNA-binding domain-containing protein n=1 Tax=Rhipicephalus sanguineus TaxID=34632 RepID=A0A9D4TBL2_RHISA|nr:hypothetical protein HPB52_019969 [Rhipicephalus sanguineus]